MLEFAHAVAGATIASKIANPAISLPLALASHFAVDLLPHWNFQLDREKQKFGKITKKTLLWLYIDSLTGLTLGLWLAKSALPNTFHALTIIAGAFLAVLPDLIEAPYFFLGKKNKFISLVMAFQKQLQWNIPLLPGIMTQILFVGLLLYLALG